jgi:hypothetical protein
MDDLAYEVRSVRVEMREGFRELREEMRDGFREARAEAGLNRRLLLSLWLTTLLGFAGLIVETGLR